MKIAVIGAGASGMMAAITAASRGCKVLLFEKNDRVGKKILATGNGKCNLTNKDFAVDKYYCSHIEKLNAVFSAFGVEELLAFFNENGLMVRERDGYVYPYCEQAAVVLDFFRRKLIHEKIQILLEKEVLQITYSQKTKQYTILCGDDTYQADKVIVSCGGPASLRDGKGMTGFQIAKSFGHKIIPVVPGLVQLRAGDSFVKVLSGVRAKAEISLLVNEKVIAKEFGELQFTDYGISGIPVFQISRLCSYALADSSKVKVAVNLFPEFDKEAFDQFFLTRMSQFGELSLEEFLSGTVHKKIHICLMKQFGLSAEQKIKKIPKDKLLAFLSHYQNLIFHIQSVNGMENAQVCAGGVDLREVSDTLESLKCPGLYFTGEVLDVDGKCGGYNLQWAFSSGYVAAVSATL